MTKYNTGNPVGSADPRDLYDNAQVIDDYANSAGDTTSDRLGVSRRTLAGMEGEFDADQSDRASEYAADKTSRDTAFDADQADRVQRFNALLAASGYVFLAEYAAGIVVTEYNEVIRDTAGNLWRASAGTDLPYTTTGAGLPEGGAFVSAGDAVLRNDLAAGVAIGQGALLVRGSVIYVDTIADLEALPVGELVDGQVVNTQGYYAPGDSGHGEYRINQNNVVDGYSSFSIGGGFYAHLIHGGVIRSTQLGVMPDGVTNWETDFAARMTALYTLSAQEGITIIFPGGFYATSMNLGNAYNGSRMHFDGAVFGGILHLISDIDRPVWTGDVASYDRLGLQGCTNAILPEKIRMLSDPTKNTVAATGNRGVHFLACSNIEWGEIIVDDTGPTQATLPGAQTIWSAFTIQSQGLGGFKGRVWVKDASGHGCYINALDIDLDIQVDGYGKSAIDFGSAGFLQGTDSEAQSEQGCGVWLNRCTGQVKINVSQKNEFPISDVYSVLFDETGISTVPASRDQQLSIRKLVASVGNGNRGVSVGEALAPSPVVNLAIECTPKILMRSAAATLESGYSGFGVRAPSTTTGSYRRLSADRNIEFVGFTTQTCFLALSATGAQVFTELDIEGIVSRRTGAGRFIQIDGTGGVLRGRIGRVSAFYNAGSSAVPVVDIDSAVAFRIEQGSLRSNSPVTTRAVRFVNVTDGSCAVDEIVNFGRANEGAVGLSGLTRCTVGPFGMRRDTLLQDGLYLSGAFSDVTFKNIFATNFARGLEADLASTFTRCTAIQCTMIGNDDDTRLKDASFSQALQLGCTNWSEA